jgi:hypothetical protein
VDVRRWIERIPLRINYILVGAIIVLQCSGSIALAAVWDYGCESAISELKNEQQDVESAHSNFESAKSEMESARSMYNLCTPSLYDDCDIERMNVNNAIQEYNDAVDTLRSHLSDFEYAVGRFNRECLS